MTRFLQINVDRRRAAHELLFQTAAREKIDLILINEPNKKMTTRKPWYVDDNTDACIIRANPNVKIFGWGSGAGFVWVKLETLYVYCAYISPNTTLEEFEAFLRGLEEDLADKGENIVIAGDFNAWSPTWGSASENRRGRTLAEWISSRNMTAANVGDRPTFQRDASQSVIDVTFTTDRLTGAVREWRVMEEESLSLHNYIGFTIVSGGTLQKNCRWKKGGFSPTKFAEIVRASRDHIDPQMDPEALASLLSRWQKQSSLSVRVDSEGGDVYWWTEEIQSLRSQALTARRKHTRARANRSIDEEERERLSEDYRDKRKALKKAILKSKNICWDRLCRDLEDDVWGAGYTIVRRSLKRNPPRVDMDRERKAEVAGDLFPAAEETVWRPIDRLALPPPLEEFTMPELRRATDRLRANRAPGPDGILPETIKAAVAEKGELILDLLNGLLSGNSFPGSWKRAKLVLIPKPGRDPREANGFRPICLLNTMGKLYEALILSRIEEELVTKGPLDDKQFGFRKGRSTVGAIQEVIRILRGAGQNMWRSLVLLDVRNAFNTARWDLIVDGLLGRGVNPRLVSLVMAYFGNRTLQIDRGVSRDVNIGVPQGSVLGPTLWNVLYDGVLGLGVPDGVNIIAYADDLAVVVADAREDGMIRKANLAMEKVDSWMTRNGLSLAPEKTEVVLFSLKKTRGPGFSLRGVELRPQKTAKYLGVIIDRHLSFGPHIQTVCDKAERTIAALTRLMPNTGGPSPRKRRVLAHAASSIILYAAQVWMEGLGIGRHGDRVSSVQRKLALRVAMLYRTVSTDAALVISGLIPIRLLAAERARTQGVDREAQGAAAKAERERTLNEWQRDFDESSKGRWTRRLINDVKSWHNRGFGEVTYFSSQFLSGHGSFGDYLYRIGKSNDAACALCGSPDSAEHAVFHCPSAARYREEMELGTGRILTVDNFIKIALESNVMWSHTMAVVHRFMQYRERALATLNP